MASRKRQSVVGYAGVYFVEALRAAGHGTEKIYYIRYRKQGKLIEEKVGGQYRDNMTAAKAASIRGLRIEQGCLQWRKKSRRPSRTTGRGIPVLL